MIHYACCLFSLIWLNTATALTIKSDYLVVRTSQRITLSANDVKGKVYWASVRGNIIGEGNEVSYIAPADPGKDTIIAIDDVNSTSISFVIQYPENISVENSVWEIFNNRDSINAFFLSENQKVLWIGTSGGLEQRSAQSYELLKVYTRLNGLPDNEIIILLGDTNDGLWVGTVSGGLGYRDVDGQWRTFTQGNSGLPSNNISGLMIDDLGGLWIGTSAGLAYRDSKDNWTVFNQKNSGLPDNDIRCILSDGADGLWIGTYHGGLAHREANGHWTVFNEDNSGLPNNHVIKLSNDGKSGLWLATLGGLTHFDANGQWTLFNRANSKIPDNTIYALLYDSHNGDLWVGTRNGLGNLDKNGNWKIFNQRDLDFSANSFVSLASDSNGGLWVGTDQGIAHRTANDQWTVLNKEYSTLPSNVITSLTKDSNNELWVGTQSGLAHQKKINGQWEFFNKINSAIPDNNISSLLSDGIGGLWVGTAGGLVYRDAKDKMRVFNKTNSAIPSNKIIDLTSDSHNGLWIGTVDGLVHLSADGQWKTTLFSNFFKNIGNLSSDDKNGLWIATIENGVAHLEANGQWKIFNQINSGIVSDNVTSVLSDGNGGLWAGNLYGLMHYQGIDQWKYVSASNSGIPKGAIIKLLSDGNGGLWIGSYGGGLAHYSVYGEWTVFNKENSALPSNIVTSLLSDENGSLWVGTKQGLAHLNFTSKGQLCLQKATKKECDALYKNQRAAILIAGGGKHQANQLWNTTNSISNYIYQILSKRGFNNDEIFYISPEIDADFNGDGFADHVVDAPKRDNELSVEDIQAAIDWAINRGRLDQPLYLLFVDHGGTEKFQLSKDKTLRVEQLMQILDTYQIKTGNEVVILLDACFSGVLGNKLRAPKRAVITSTDNSYAYFNRLSNEGFSRFLAKGLSQGRTFSEAFDYASTEQQKLLDNLHLRVSVTGDAKSGTVAIEQKPQKFDKNTINTLDKLFLNGSFVTGENTLAITSINPNSTQSANTTINLTAIASVAQGEVKRVWAVIRPPHMDLVLDQYNTPILALPKVELARVAGQTQKWQAPWSDTRYNGDYSLTFYAQDSRGEIVSSETTTRINVSQGINPPEHVTTQIKLNQNQYKAGDTLTATISEELNWGYDLYLAIGLPQGSILTLNNLNDFNAPTLIKPWRGERKQGQAITVLNMILPQELPSGQYCLYAVQSPEQQDPMQTTSQRYWQSSQQCFTLHSQ